MRLQKGNPGREIFSGSGENYAVDYTYVYDEKDRPLTKNGDLVFASGPHAGQRFQTSSAFSYY